MSTATRQIFTLVELLVVIAIIAILASLLLPVINSARERGKTISCAANLRQLGLCPGMYESDFDGYLFPLEYALGGTTTNRYDTLLAEQRYVKAFNTDSTKPIGYEKTVFQCPSGAIKQASASPSSRVDINGACAYRDISTSSRLVIDNWYGINGITNNTVNLPFYRIPRDVDNAVVVHKMSNLKKLSRVVAMFDGWSMNLFVYPNRLNLRHGGNRTSNLMFLDGHVGNYNNRQLPITINTDPAKLSINYPDQVWLLNQP